MFAYEILGLKLHLGIIFRKCLELNLLTNFVNFNWIPLYSYLQLKVGEYVYGTRQGVVSAIWHHTIMHKVCGEACHVTCIHHHWKWVCNRIPLEFRKLNFLEDLDSIPKFSHLYKWLKYLSFITILKNTHMEHGKQTIVYENVNNLQFCMSFFPF